MCVPKRRLCALGPMFPVRTKGQKLESLEVNESERFQPDGWLTRVEC